MTTLELKSNFHRLIDNINNDNVLIKFYDILDKANQNVEGTLWNSLSFEDQEELISIEKESYFTENLIHHSQIVEKYKKWL